MSKREWISKEHKLYRLANGRVYARPSIPGVGRKEFAIPAKAKTLKQMIAARDRIAAQKIRESKPKANSEIRFEDMGEEVISLKVHRSDATRISAELHLRKHLIPWFNIFEPYVDQITEATWEHYIVAQLQKNPTRKLFNDRKHMAMVMKHAYKKGIIARRLEFRNPDPEVHAGRRVTRQEIDRLLKAANPSTKTQVLMAITMGMRKSEILKLEWERVDFDARTIHLRARDTKIRRARTMGISKPVLKALKAIKLESASPYVFPSRYNQALPTATHKTAWNACKRRAGVKCRFHDLRHAFLSVALLERKLNPLHVAVYAGVSLAEIQRTYLHPSVDDTREVALGNVWVTK